jgi:two-component system sensor histidine kinase RegB
MEPSSIRDIANKQNLRLLINLRWFAVAGQVSTILFVKACLGIALPLLPMGGVILFLVALNLATLYRSRTTSVVTSAEIYIELLIDVIALTMLLYLSGGATNPFVSLFLLQVILGAVLLEPRLIWTLVVVASGCFLFLTTSYHDIGLAPPDEGRPIGPFNQFQLDMAGSFISYLLAAVLLVLFVTRINRNVRRQDQRLSALRQQSAEEEHIVRMGLLASGAAHELGTPLATLSVILNDWQRMPELQEEEDLAFEIGEMQRALVRCKDIVSRILLAAGEARGEDAERTTLVDFLDDVVDEWRKTRRPPELHYENTICVDTPIVSDTVMRQILFNVFDNALEASPDWVDVHVSKRDHQMIVTVSDRGPGFAPSILANFGKPYQSTKSRSGSGLGLFLVVNVIRKLGGTVTPSNQQGVGARVEIVLPMRALSVEDEEQDAL